MRNKMRMTGINKDVLLAPKGSLRNKAEIRVDLEKYEFAIVFGEQVKRARTMYDALNAVRKMKRELKVEAFIINKQAEKVPYKKMLGK